MAKKRTIVVTGATGFIAKHVMAKLLLAGFGVRGTLRNEAKADGVKQTMVNMCGAEGAKNLDLVVCDLLSDGGWTRAMQDGQAVMHMATYVPAREPKQAHSVIRPALEGTERVLRFANDAGIKRVVMTSSIAAIGYGHKVENSIVSHDASDWTDVAGLEKSWAYAEAKTLSEKRAWEMAEEFNMDLTSVCPSMVFGPALDDDTSASLKVVKMLMNGKVPALPPGGMSVVDVRDVAQIHVNALDHGPSHRQRIIASAEYISFLEVARILQSAYPDRKFPAMSMPVWLMKFLGKFDRSIKQIAADLVTERHYDGAPGAELMQRDYRDGQEATLSAAESLIELGVVSAAK